MVQKIPVERVLRDMWQETKTPLMIYATEAALNVARTPLPAQLQRFTRAENKVFQQELHNEGIQLADAAQAAANEKILGSGPLGPISPSKRKHRADSIDSMDSNRASIGSDDVQNDFYNNPFEDGQTSTATMTASGTPAATTVVETGEEMGADTMMTPASDNEGAKE